MTDQLISKTTEFSRDFEVDPKKGDYSELLEKAMVFLQEEVRETQEAIIANDLPEIVDGFGDVAFIALNGIYKTLRKEGFSHKDAVKNTHEVMQRICNANLGKKQPDGTIAYKEGKVQKPASWAPPAYDDILKTA